MAGRCGILAASAGDNNYQLLASILVDVCYKLTRVWFAPAEQREDDRRRAALGREYDLSGTCL